MKFLREQVESIELITEGTGAEKTLYIEGIFAQAEKKNRNNRIYPKQIMENAVNRYITEFVHTRRAMGELSHPESRPMVKPELASHLITTLRMEGNDVYGKAKVLNTPQGAVLRGLLEGGVQMGVSTRGLGSIEERAGVTYVKDDYIITTVDAVSDPSAIDAWVNPLLESAEYNILQDGRIVQLMLDTQKKRVSEDVAFATFGKLLKEITRK
jgi:hypothetical protein